jgi:hypothetical protein
MLEVEAVPQSCIPEVQFYEKFVINYDICILLFDNKYEGDIWT